MSASPGSLETRHGALSNSSPTGHPWLSTLFHSPVSPRIPHSHSLHARYENDHISVEEYKREESPEKNRVRSISTVGSGISLTCHSIFILVHQVLSNVGYGVTSLLNLALLLPPTTANDRQLYAYLVPSFFPSNGFIAEYAIGATRTGFYLEFGSVRVHYQHS